MKVGQKYVLDKQAFLAVLDSLRRGAKLIGPTAGPDGDVIFREVESTSEFTHDYVNEFDPIKRFFIPHRQDLFRFQLGKTPKFEPLVDTSPQILFGIRSCDVKGILHWDKFFTGVYADNYYLAKRANTTIISVACNRPLDTCFCICCDGGPWLESGFDLQLSDFGDRYLIDVGSAKGVALLAKVKKGLVAATRQDLEHRKELMATCDSQMVPTAYVAKAIIQITNRRVREELWDEMGYECFSCGGCTHVCPVCTCYDVADYMETPTSGVRFRCWDSCQYSGFTREASGHNPREKAKERIKRRFYHKLSYAYVKLDGHHGCVGCGRCITVCEAIGMLDLPAVVKRLRREGQPAPEEQGA